jgi:hypothetical protein
MPPEKTPLDILIEAALAQCGDEPKVAAWLRGIRGGERACRGRIAAADSNESAAAGTQSHTAAKARKDNGLLPGPTQEKMS